MRFFVGLHHPADAAKLPPGQGAFISRRALRRRRSGFRTGDCEWLMDSGAFTELALHGEYRCSVANYAAEIRRWCVGGRCLAAVAQDYMCEPFMLAKTGFSIADHQRLTIERFDALTGCDTGGVAVMPVLQGYAPADYVSHIGQYGSRLKPEMWVGVGSVCKRNGNPTAALQVLSAIKGERPDLLLHGFGLKTTALGDPEIRALLHSADSMAWSLAARYEGRDRNAVSEAIRYAARIGELTACRI